MKDISRLFDIPHHQMASYPLKQGVCTKYKGIWVSSSTAEYIEQANSISRGLLSLGIGPNDKIAVVSMTNRAEWNIVDIGVLQLGAQNVPIHPTISETEYEHALRHSEYIICFVSFTEHQNM